MKRKSLIIPALVAALCLSMALPSLAAGSLSVTEKKLLTWEDYSGDPRGLLYAIVTNTGDEPAMLEEGFLKLFDAEGGELFDSRLDIYPRLLAPGQSGAVSAYGDITDLDAPGKVASEELSYTLVASPYIDITYYPAEGKFIFIEDEIWPVAQVITEVKNDTDAPVYDIEVSCVIRDEAGGLLATLTTWTYRVGIPAGGSMLVREELPEELLSELREKGVTTAQVEALAYTTEYVW